MTGATTLGGASPGSIPGSGVWTGGGHIKRCVRLTPKKRTSGTRPESVLYPTARERVRVHTDEPDGRVFANPGEWVDTAVSTIASESLVHPRGGAERRCRLMTVPENWASFPLNDGKIEHAIGEPDSPETRKRCLTPMRADDQPAGCEGSQCKVWGSQGTMLSSRHMG